MIHIALWLHTNGLRRNEIKISVFFFKRTISLCVDLYHDRCTCCSVQLMFNSRDDNVLVIFHRRGGNEHAVFIEYHIIRFTISQRIRISFTCSV
jgi:hypothetical protein